MELGNILRISWFIHLQIVCKKGRQQREDLKKQMCDHANKPPKYIDRPTTFIFVFPIDLLTMKKGKYIDEIN